MELPDYPAAPPAEATPLVVAALRGKKPVDLPASLRACWALAGYGLGRVMRPQPPHPEPGRRPVRGLTRHMAAKALEAAQVLEGEGEPEWDVVLPAILATTAELLNRWRRAQNTQA